MNLHQSERYDGDLDQINPSKYREEWENSRFKVHCEVELTELNDVTRKKRAVGYYLWVLPWASLWSTVCFTAMKMPEMVTEDGRMTDTRALPMWSPDHPPNREIRWATCTIPYPTFQLDMPHISNSSFQKENGDPKHSCFPYIGPQQSHSKLFSCVLKLHAEVVHVR